MQNLFNSFLNFIFPPTCISCGHPGKFICLKCQNTFLIPHQPECFFCRKISNNFTTHDTCIVHSIIQQAIICWQYNELAKRCMAASKRRHRYKILEFITQIGSTRFPSLFSEEVILVPIPSSQAHIFERGFNSSLIIAKALAKKFDLKIWDGLERVKGSKSQAEKTREERLQQRSEEFRIKTPEIDLAGCQVWLIDDVCTTGTTLINCAKVITQKFPDVKVSAFALFRGKKFQQLKQLSPLPPQLLHPPHPP